MKKPKKKLLISLVALILVAAIGVGIWFSTRSSGEPVPVFPFRYLGMTEYWGDNQESYGPVSTDRVQTVYITETQVITEICVAQGDVVKKGDLLMTFDTTLTDLALERKRLDVEKLKLQLQKAEERLQEIKTMKPMKIPSYSGGNSETNTDTGAKLEGPYQLSHNREYDGSTRELALICWLNTAASMDDSVLEALRQKAELYQNRNAEESFGGNAAAMPQSEDLPSEEETEPEATEPEETEPGYVPFAVNEYYAIVKVTEGNGELGNRIAWQGFHVKGNAEQGFSFRLFDAYGVMDHMLDEDSAEADTSIPEIDYGSGYTSAQLAQMRRDQETKITDLKFNIKMAETNYLIMQTEATDGNVYSEIDGEVVSVLPEEEARKMRQPIVKVSGGGGFFVEGYISELEKENLAVGQEVTVNDWNTGMTYPGTVTAVGDYPTSSDGWNGIGNPNASYYPFTAFVDEIADLQAGSYASIQFSTAGTEHGLYLENPFIRSEQGNFYVYVRGKNGKLEKRYIAVGKSLWGSYKEVLSGISEEDLIAFPYGKNVKEGADTVESDLSVLYQ